MNQLLNLETLSIEKIKSFIIIAIGVSIPVSTVLTNIFVFSALLLLLIEGHYKLYLKILSQNIIALISLTFFALVLLGMLYSPAHFKETLSIVSKYRELFFIVIFILLFQEDKTRQWGIQAFIFIMIITLFLSCIIAVTGWEIGKGTADNPVVFKNHISQGILMSLAAYFLAVQAWQNEKWRKWRVGITLLAIYNVVFMTQGRTGYVALACLILLFFYQCYTFRGILLGIIAVCILSTIAYFYSENAKMRIAEASRDMKKYQQGQTVGSIALRLEFLKNGAILSLQNPILGGGTGSFDLAYKKLSKIKVLRHTNNPHNEYLMISVQWGVLGLAIFLYLLYQQWRLSYRLNKENQWFAQGIVLTMCVGCLVNSLLLDFTEGHIYAYFTALFYAKSDFLSNTLT